MAQNAKMSQGYLSSVISNRNIASYEKQISIAKACGYTHEDFLRYGKRLQKSDSAQQKEQISSPQTSPQEPEPDRNTEETDQKMNESTKELLQLYKDLVAGAKQEKIELKQEIKDLKTKIDQLYTQNIKLAEKLGEANRKLRDQQAQIPGNSKKSAANG